MEVVAPALLVPSKYGLENAAFYVFGLVILSRWPHCAVFFFPWRSVRVLTGGSGYFVTLNSWGAYPRSSSGVRLAKPENAEAIEIPGSLSSSGETAKNTDPGSRGGKFQCFL